jgi:hypothetical protein
MGDGVPVNAENEFAVPIKLKADQEFVLSEYS